VMLNAVKQVTTKRGDRMAIVQIEDLTGQTEAVVFPQSLWNFGSLLWMLDDHLGQSRPARRANSVDC